MGSLEVINFFLVTESTSLFQKSEELAYPFFLWVWVFFFFFLYWIINVVIQFTEAKQNKCSKDAETTKSFCKGYINTSNMGNTLLMREKVRGKQLERMIYWESTGAI